MAWSNLRIQNRCASWTFCLELNMNEAEQNLHKRRRYIKQATDINRKHADMMKTESIARPEARVFRGQK